MVNKTQVRNIPFSNRVFLAHMCPIHRKTAAGYCNGNQRWVEVVNHEFRSEHPHQGNRSAFRRSVAPGDFHLKGTSGVTRSLSWLYTGRDQYETAFELGFLLFLAFNIWSLKWRNSTRELGFSFVLSAALERVIIFNMHCVDVFFCSVNNPFSAKDCRLC